MFKFNWLLSTGFATAMFAAGLSANLTQLARAQGNPPTTGARVFQEFFNKQDNPPPGETGVGGTRGEFCAMTPLNWEETVAEIWSDRPLFVWRGLGIIDRIALRLPDSEEMLWEQQVRARAGRIMYDGEALQPGQTYEWVLTNAENEATTISFKVMEESERDRISQELSQLEQDLQEQGASTEEIAWQRATYFAQQLLWSDALREIYSVETPSPELGEAMQDIANLICTP